MSERKRRWALALGGEDAALTTDSDQRMSRALDALYDEDQPKSGGLGGSAPRVARWLGDIREFFPAPVVQVIQKDAFDRKGLRQILLQPEFLATVEADVHLVADLIALRNVMPDKTIETARQVIGKVVADLLKRLESRTAEAIRGAVDRGQRTSRPRFADIDWPRTITANLQHYQPDLQTVIPERLIGYQRRQRRLADLDEVVLCVDQSGSMATSVVYSSIFAAVMASIPAVKTRLVCFDTSIVDLTEDLADPVQVLISDLYEGGNAEELLARIARLVGLGVNMIALLALSDSGRPGYDPRNAEAFAALGVPVFACTPDRFPALMAAALRREDIAAWAAGEDIKLAR